MASDKLTINKYPDKDSTYKMTYCMRNKILDNRPVVFVYMLISQFITDSYVKSKDSRGVEDSASE